MDKVSKLVRIAIDNIRGNPCDKWMVCLYAFGCKGQPPYPMLCEWRFGKPWGYDFFYLQGPFDTKEDAARECLKYKGVKWTTA